MKLTKAKLAEIRKAAEKASPGPYKREGPLLRRPNPLGEKATARQHAEQHECDLRYLEHLDPATVLALVRAAERADELIEAWDEMRDFVLGVTEHDNDTVNYFLGIIDDHDIRPVRQALGGEHV